MIQTVNYSVAKIKNYKELFVANYKSDDIIEFADSLLNGVLTLGYKNIEALRYNPHDLQSFDWNQAPAKSGNSFSLYLLGLRHIYLLTEAARIQYNPIYLELAEDFVKSFYDYLFSNIKHNGMINNDHALSERIENLVYLYSIALEVGYSLRNGSFALSIIEDSINKLLGDKYYQRNHNHGIIVDKAALIGVFFLKKNDMNEKINFLIQRLKAQVEYAYAKDGVHKENSFDYHVSITGLLQGCADLLKKINDPYYDTLTAYLRQANEFMVYALKPNGYRPLFGDSKGVPSSIRQTDGSIVKVRPNITIFGENPNMEYIRSMGCCGEMPSKRLAFFPSGYVFFREHFNRNFFAESTWLSLKAGYTTRVHKHQDDLSICLYSKGYDVFVDSGMYGYMPKDKYKDYTESLPAHTTVGLVGKSYSIANGNGEKFKIQKCLSTTHYDYAVASARVYEDIAIYRHVYYLRRENIVFICDELFSSCEQEYVQYFHLSDSSKILDSSARKTVLSIGDTEYNAVIRQLTAVDSVRILDGEKTNPMSILSTGFGAFIETQTLMYTKRCCSSRFLTCIEIKHKSASDAAITTANSNITIKDIVIPLPSTTPVRFQSVEIRAEGVNIIVQNKSLSKDQKHTLYVYNHSQNEALAKLPYTQNEDIVFENDSKASVILLYYIANGSGELLKGIIGKCDYQENGSVNITRYSDLHHPVINGNFIDRLDNNTYIFSVCVAYDYPSMCKWWVYYNGANYSFESNASYEMTYTFHNAGEYVVMYSFRDRFFGEYVFDQFDKIVI